MYGYISISILYTYIIYNVVDITCQYIDSNKSSDGSANRAEPFQQLNGVNFFTKKSKNACRIFIQNIPPKK